MITYYQLPTSFECFRVCVDTTFMISSLFCRFNDHNSFAWKCVELTWYSCCCYHQLQQASDLTNRTNDCIGRLSIEASTNRRQSYGPWEWAYFPYVPTTETTYYFHSLRYTDFVRLCEWYLMMIIVRTGSPSLPEYHHAEESKDYILLDS